VRTPEQTAFKSGFVALIGRPNVGKSTLMNRLVGQKIAIMSHRPQTTRNQIRGVLTTPDAQLIFIDTPGIHKPKHRLGEFMVETAASTLKEVDVVCWVCDVTEPNHSGDEYILERLKGISTPVICILNKVDAISKPNVLVMMDRLSKVYDFAEMIPVSAKDGTQVDVLSETLVKYVPEGPQYYPNEMVTDYPEQFIIAEIIREKVLHLTQEEIPHSVMVDIEQLERRDTSGVIYAHAIIYTERDSQKGILIGKRGAMLKKVGQLARQELEALLGNKVYLELWVKVKKDWRNDPSLLHRFGFHEDR
jgi:GTPase